MSAATANLYIEQNASFDETIIWSVGGTPVPLLGYTAKMQIRAYTGAPDPPLYTLTTLTGGTPQFSTTTGNGAITLGPAAGQINLFLPDSITEGFTWTTAVYDLYLVDSGGNSTRVLQGGLTAGPAVTTLASIGPLPLSANQYALEVILT